MIHSRRLFTSAWNFPPKINGVCSRWGQNANLWIPKNASTTFRAIFGATRHYIPDFDVETYWVVLRNPYARWLSGVLTFLYRNPNDQDFVYDNIEQIAFDMHTVPQIDYLDFDYTQNTNFLNINNDNWLDNLSKDLNYNLDPTLKLNSLSEKPEEQELLEKLSKIITPKLKYKINEFYYEDIMLLETVKYR